MRTLPLLRALALLALTVTAALAQDAPKIASVSPPVGAVDVRADIGQILVIFDRDMQQGALSIFASTSGEMPPVGEEVGWLDARTLRLPLGALEAGKTYALMLNNAERQRIRSAEGVPLSPFEVRFATVKQGAPAPVPSEERPPATEDPYKQEMALRGTWRLEKVGEAAAPTILFFHIGLSNWFFVEESASKRRFLSAGGMVIVRDDGTLICMDEENAEVVPLLWLPSAAEEVTSQGGKTRPEWEWILKTPHWRLQGKDLLVLHGAEDGGPTVVLRRQPEVVEADLVGTWRPASDGTPKSLAVPKETWVFAAGGKMSEKKTKFGRESEVPGVWKLSSELLAIRLEGQKEEKLHDFLLHRFQNEKDGAVLLIDGGAGKPWMYVRREDESLSTGGGEGASSIVGSWVAADDDNVRLVFEADGKYSRETREGGKVVDGSTGTFRLEGAVLLAEDAKEGALQIPFRLVDPDTLELDIDGVKTAFKRDAGGGVVVEKPPEAGGGKTARLKAALIGAWAGNLETVYGTPGGLVVLTFTEDGKYDGYWTPPGGGPIPQFGTWRLTGATLTLTGPEGAPVLLQMAIEGDALSLDRWPAMKACTLSRQ